MLTKDFDFVLPAELIAKYPVKNRTNSRLCCLQRAIEEVSHDEFCQLADLLSTGDLLVLNDTKVMAARLYGSKLTGGKVEILVERADGKRAVAHMRSNRAIQIGTVIKVGKYGGRVSNRIAGGFFELTFDSNVHEILAELGEIPLPPYMKRAATDADRLRYQTVYADRDGSVAAPTAGLHFDEEFLVKLQERGIEVGKLTLHVGAGTFKPVQVEVVNEHTMHSEYMEVNAKLCGQIKETKARGNKVVAVGTTCVKALETLDKLEPFCGETKLFITPGFKFKVVDALLTNFHLPKSTLLMLVSAFAGKELVMRAYEEAILRRYRFYSYGDAMLIR